MTSTNLIIVTYIVSIAYCIWRFTKSSKKMSFDGVIGVTPGLEMMATILIGPFLMIGDLFVTGFEFISKKLKRVRKYNELMKLRSSNG